MQKRPSFSTPFSSRLISAAVCTLILTVTSSASAKLLLTQVLPSVNVSSTNGDTVEIYNTGPGAVNLTGYFLSDLDGLSPATTMTSEPDGTFAPASLSLPTLPAGKFAVIVFTTGSPSYQSTNYGLRITATTTDPAGPFNQTDQCVLADTTGAALDAVCWYDGGSAFSNFEAQDMQTLTTPTTSMAGFGTQTADNSWDAPDTIADEATYVANAVVFTTYGGTSTYGQGSLRRKSTNGVWSEGTPDCASNWEIVDRSEVRLGNFSGPVPNGSGGFSTIKITASLVPWLTLLETDISLWPDSRVATQQNNDDYIIPNSTQLTAWRAVIAQIRLQNWEAAHGLARPLGYELVEFLDSATGVTSHILREIAAPGHSGFTGQGTFLFDGTPQSDLILEVPHVLYDQNTLAQGALATSQLRPRALIIAGTHRQNSTAETPCDGDLSPGVPYRYSDPAHTYEAYFHVTHEEMQNVTANTVSIQFHGYGTSNEADQPDAILTTGRSAALSNNNIVFESTWRDRINAQNKSLTDSTGPHTAEAGLFGLEATTLGASENVQGRFTNGRTCPNCCTQNAASANGRFCHIEQSGAVRADPQFIITALQETVALRSLAVPVHLSKWQLE